MVGEEQKILAMSDTMSQEQSLYLSLASLRRRYVEGYLDGLQDLVALADYKVALAGTLTEIIDAITLWLIGSNKLKKHYCLQSPTKVVANKSIVSLIQQCHIYRIYFLLRNS